MLFHSYAIVGMVALIICSASLLVAALWRTSPSPSSPQFPDSWKQYRFGFTVYALIFLAFDMEMIFMYPWAVVFVDFGMEAFLDMLVFIGLLSAGLAYAWRMGGLEWE